MTNKTKDYFKKRLLLGLKCEERAGKAKHMRRKTDNHRYFLFHVIDITVNSLQQNQFEYSPSGTTLLRKSSLHIIHNSK